MGARLRERELVQVGPGMGVEIDCVIDSGDVGDMPAIDAVGARRGGLRPFILDPLGIHPSDEYTPVASLVALAELVASS